MSRAAFKKPNKTNKQQRERERERERESFYRQKVSTDLCFHQIKSDNEFRQPIINCHISDFVDGRYFIVLRLHAELRQYPSAIRCHQFNPFISMLAAPSLWKRPIKIPNLKLLRLFCPPTWKDFCQNAQYWKCICYRTIKYTVWRRVCVHFSARKIYSLWQWRV